MDVSKHCLSGFKVDLKRKNFTSIFKIWNSSKLTPDEIQIKNRSKSVFYTVHIYTMNFEERPKTFNDILVQPVEIGLYRIAGQVNDFKTVCVCWSIGHWNKSIIEKYPKIFFILFLKNNYRYSYRYSIAIHCTCWLNGGKKWIHKFHSKDWFQTVAFVALRNDAFVCVLLIRTADGESKEDLKIA